MTRSFDLVVIGTGAGGTNVARRCRAAGWQVAIADELSFGGTCQLRGCDPKKVLVGVAEALDAIRRFGGKGIDPGGAGIRWADLMRFKASFTDQVSERKEAGFVKDGIEPLHGRARLVGPTALELAGEKPERSERIEARHLLIATGARPMDLPIAGREHLTFSDRFLDLPDLPRRIVFLGGGFISFELAHVARVAGAEVFIVELLDRPLAGFDPELVDLLAERTRAMGIDLRLGTKVEALEKHAGAFTVRARRGDEAVALDADLVVHGAGRVPAVDDLGLAAAGVEFDPRKGVTVNRRMQSVSNPAVYAVGDAAAGGLQLTPVASFEARVAADNLLGTAREIDYPAIPSAVFTIPPLAAIGLSEAEARKKGLELEVRWERTSSWYSSRRLAESASGYKLIAEKSSGRILGAHALGHGAEELVNQLAIAMRAGLTGKDLKGMIFAYPSLGSDLQYMV
jgi:glutathione reductase (NADPH)